VRRSARALRNWVVRRDLRGLAKGLPTNVRDRFTIRRMTEYPRDLDSRASAFHVRLRYDADHLAWRYAQNLSFIRYHAFEILDRGQPIGFAILNERPGSLMVAHSDAASVEALAAGWTLAIAALARENPSLRHGHVRLTARDPELLAILRTIGYSISRKDRVLAFGGFPRHPELPTDHPGWHLDIDIGDNGLRFPFLT
jgi:hypothetical protein